ncbi:hypothetical protein ACVWZM_005220 [Bradyrhizobium sp. USDA 4501]
MRVGNLTLAMLPALSLGACQDYGTDERLQAAADIVGAAYGLRANYLEMSFDKRDANTLVVSSKRGPYKRYELREPERCTFRFTVDAGMHDAQTTTADLSKLTRLEVAPTISGNFGIVYLAGSEANTVTVHTQFGDQKSNKVQLNNLAPAQIDAFLSKVAEFQEKMCGIKVKIPGS